MYKSIYFVFLKLRHCQDSRLYLFLNPTLPIFIVVQDALVIADVMLIFAEVVSLMVGLVTVHLAAVSQSETVTTCSASRKG
mgnify:CR=1 FL=1